MEQENIRLERARKRVNDIKGFYQHLTVYLVVNALILLFSKRITILFISNEVVENIEFLNWINWNIWGTPIIWGVALAIHAGTVFLKSPFKNWEERQIRKIMDEEREEVNKFGNY